MWDFFKAFAGPLATVIAAAAAVWVTWRLGSRQAEIASSQARTAQAQADIARAQLAIAYDKLKHDLFDKRYEIYLAAKNAIERILKTGVPDRPIIDETLRDLRIKFDEARFFFPDTTLRVFDKIEVLIREHETARMYHQRCGDDDHEIRSKHGDAMAQAFGELGAVYNQLPALFANDMGFDQLTSPRPTSAS